MFRTTRGNSLTWAITLSCASAYVLFGYDQGVIGGLISQPTFQAALDHPSASYTGTILALFYPGCVVGAITAASVGKKLGRRKVILIGSCVMLIGVIFQTATNGPVIFVVGRIITGFGNGLNTSTVPIYVSETAGSGRRGSMVCVQMAIVIFGLVLAYWIDYATVKTLSNEMVWRLPIGLQVILALITAVTIIFMPESPRWLYQSGKKEEALKVLCRLIDCDEGDERVMTIIDEMSEAIRLEDEQEPFKLKHLWWFNDKSDVKIGRRLMLVFLIPLFGQLTGINVLSFYVTIVLEQNVGLSLETSSLVAGFIQLAYFLGCLPPIWTVERFGRRPTLLISSALLCIFMILFTVSLTVDTKGASSLALAMLICYEVVFGGSWNCLPWIIAPEITPLNYRHIGGALGPGSQYLFTLIVVLITPDAIANIGWRIYLLFDIGLFAGFLFIYFYLPETQGKSLEEIDYIFAGPEAKERFRLRLDSAAHCKNSAAIKDEEELQEIEI